VHVPSVTMRHLQNGNHLFGACAASDIYERRMLRSGGAGSDLPDGLSSRRAAPSFQPTSIFLHQNAHFTEKLLLTFMFVREMPQNLETLSLIRKAVVHQNVDLVEKSRFPIATYFYSRPSPIYFLRRGGYYKNLSFCVVPG
jgi:hypothetical protein